MTAAQLVLLPFLVLVLPAMAAVAWWLRRRYTAAVVILQAGGRASEQSRDDARRAEAAGPSPPPGAVPPLRIHVRDPRATETLTDSAEDSIGAAVLRRRVLLVHAFSEQVYWCTLMLLVFFAVVGRDLPGVLRIIAPVILPFVITPVLVAWSVQAGLPRRLMSIAAIVVVIYAFSLLWSDAEAWQSEFGFSIGYAAIILMVSAFLRPTIRGAGLPLVAASIVAWPAFTMLFAVALALEGPDDGSPIALADVVGGTTALVLMLAVFAWCGWRALQEISRRYAARRFSDVQLALVTYWAVLTLFLIGSLVREPDPLDTRAVGLEWVVLAIVALWFLWRRVQAIALRRVIRAAEPSVGPLLLLRVFKPSGRSQAFTDRFFAYWRFAGPVWMIGGPDLAGAYMEPNEFFAYLRGRLREQFVADPAEAAQRVATLDADRDPDGRFRVTEVYCTAETWQPTVLEMMARARVILLDLREYSPQRQGTRYELTELLRRAPLHKVLMLVDARDGLARLRDEIESIWRDVGGYRQPAMETEELTLLELRTGSASEMRGLFRAAVRAC